MNTAFVLKHPAAVCARGIENILIAGHKKQSMIVKVGYAVLARLISLTAFPAFLSLELAFKRLPKLLASIPVSRAGQDQVAAQARFYKKLDAVKRTALGIVFSPLGVRSADGVSGLFLKQAPSNTMVAPFGVEMLYGKKVQPIRVPETVEELQQLVKEAKRDCKKISIIGAGMSQGPQTVPVDDNHMVIDTRKLKKITFGKNNVSVQAGATWEEIQLRANQQGKSVIVKQASDIFSVGGSIAINCHGWAHEYGAIASTVESLEVIDADGELRILTPDDEMFGCMFGTLGYFGVIVSATLKLVDNEPLIETAEEVELGEFVEHYENKVKGRDFPLFGGRLVLDDLESAPLRKVCMVKYEKEPLSANANASSSFVVESKYGTRLERVMLQAIGHLSYFTSRRLLSKFWDHERLAMLSRREMMRNEALHPPINAFKMLHHSNLHTQWLQEYFVKKENLPNFLRFLGAELKANQVKVINATIRPTPQDRISVLPYAEQDRYGVVICFAQVKTDAAIKYTQQWMKRVNEYLIDQGDVYYQAYMPYATREQFEKCYGKERIEKMRELKKKYDPSNMFSNGHTRKYFDI